MKKLFTVSLILFGFHSFSQDIITKKNGDEIESKVLEVGEKVIKYKKHSNLDGPTYSVNKSELFMIKYENGEKDLFNEKQNNSSTSTSNNNGSKVVTVTYSKLNTGKSSSSGKEVYHAIKIDPILFIVGELPIFYEHRLGDKASVEVGLGITMFDYIHSGVISGEQTITEYYDSRDVKLGYTISAEYRFYPSNSTRALEDIYFGPHIKYKRYNTTLVNCGTPLTSPKEEYVTYLNTELKVGYLIYFSDRVFFDWYGGLGLKFTNNKGYDCSYIGNTSVVVNNDYQKMTPTISLGMRIGFSF